MGGTGIAELMQGCTQSSWVEESRGTWAVKVKLLSSVAGHSSSLAAEGVCFCSVCLLPWIDEMPVLTSEGESQEVRGGSGRVSKHCSVCGSPAQHTARI